MEILENARGVCPTVRFFSPIFSFPLQVFVLFSSPWQLKLPPLAAARPVPPCKCTNSRSLSCSPLYRSGSSALLGFLWKTEPCDRIHLDASGSEKKESCVNLHSTQMFLNWWLRHLSDGTKQVWMTFMQVIMSAKTRAWGHNNRDRNNK